MKPHPFDNTAAFALKSLNKPECPEIAFEFDQEHYAGVVHGL